MTLKERISKYKNPMTKEKVDAAMNSPEIKLYGLFLKICERLENNIDDETSCNTYEEVFNEIEKRNINVSDIIPKEKYDEFKKTMSNDKAQSCPHIGKEPDRIYNLGKEKDRLEFAKLHDYNITF